MQLRKRLVHPEDNLEPAGKSRAGGATMNKAELLQQALFSVSLQVSHTRHNLDTVQSLNNPTLVQEVQQEHDRLQCIYRQLLAWWVELEAKP